MSISIDSISLLQQNAIVWTVGIETMKTASAEDTNCMWRMIGFAKMQCLTEYAVSEGRGIKMKYIIELDEISNTGLFKVRGANSLVFDRKGIKNILKQYKEEPEIDWSQVAVDTLILVRDRENGTWSKRHFAKYEDGKVYAWDMGRTSWTTTAPTRITAWRYAKLAEAGEEE